MCYCILAVQVHRTTRTANVLTCVVVFKLCKYVFFCVFTIFFEPYSAKTDLKGPGSNFYYTPTQARTRRLAPSVCTACVLCLLYVWEERYARAHVARAQDKSKKTMKFHQKYEKIRQDLEFSTFTMKMILA